MTHDPTQPHESTVRRRLSDQLIQGAFDRSCDTQVLEAELAARPSTQPGYELARSVARQARRRDALLLWLGFRLRPRS